MNRFKFLEGVGGVDSKINRVFVTELFDLLYGVEFFEVINAENYEVVNLVELAPFKVLFEIKL